VQPFRTILFAADFSANSTEAFRTACSLAVEHKTKLVVLHVLEPDWVAKKPDYLGEGVAPPDHTEGLPEFLKRRMCEIYVPTRPLDVEYRVSEGSAAVRIVHLADAIGANLIAMGTHGRTGLRRLLTGSVAATVLLTAHCSILALRSGNDEHKTDDLRVILHPTDFSKVSEAALDVARSLARDHGARLIVLHVAPFDISRAGRLTADWDPREYQQSLNAIRNRIDGPDLRYPIETRLSRGFEAEEILRLAQEIKPDLVVMGTHGRTGLRRILVGNTAASVLPKANCPVLVVKKLEREHNPISSQITTGARSFS